MFLKKLKHISLFLFGFFYSFAVITFLAIVTKIGQLVEKIAPLLVKGIFNLLKGLFLGYVVFCIGSITVAIGINLVSGTPAALLSMSSPIAVLFHLLLNLSAIISPILLPILPYVAIAAAISFIGYIGVWVIHDLTVGLWHSIMDFCDQGFKKALVSPWKYQAASVMYQQYGFDRSYQLERLLENRAITTKADIMRTVSDHYSNTVSIMLRKLLPNAITPIITEYAFTAASSVPEEIDSRNYASWEQNTTIAIESMLCSFYYIIRNNDTILKFDRKFYDFIKGRERDAVFESDLFLQSYDEKKSETEQTEQTEQTEFKVLCEEDVINFSKEHSTPLLAREGNKFKICGVAAHLYWRVPAAELKLSEDQITFLNTLPFAEGIIKRSDPRFFAVKELLKSYHVHFEEKHNMHEKFRATRFAEFL